MARSSVQRLIDKKKGTVECPSCGAIYVIHEKNCPWCGAANDLGQEEDYISELDDINEELGSMKDYAKKKMGHEAGTMLKRAIPVIVILLVIAGVIVFLHVREENKYSVKIKASMKWQQENFPKLNELYDEEKYDELVDFFNDYYASESAEYGGIYSWEHYTFMQSYMNYLNVLKYREFAARAYSEDKETGLRNSMTRILYYGLTLLYTNWDKTYSNGKITKKEYEMIKDHLIEIEDIIRNDLGADPEELRESCTVEDYDDIVDFEGCQKMAETLNWNGK